MFQVSQLTIEDSGRVNGVSSAIDGFPNHVF